MLGLAALSLAQLPRGTEIRLVLLKDLNSGGSVVGEPVPMMVADDVKVNGRVVVKAGTPAVGTVRQARREGALSAAVFDRPARLAIELERTWDVAGRAIPLTAKLNGPQQDLFHFTRQNTKLPKLSREAQAVFRDDAKRRAFDRLVDAVKGSRSLENLRDNTERALLLSVANELGLESTTELIVDRRLRDLVQIGAALSAPSLAGFIALRGAVGAIPLAFRATREIVRIAVQFPNFLSRKFGGRNINAPMGLEFSALAD